MINRLKTNLEYFIKIIIAKFIILFDSKFLLINFLSE